MSLGLYCFGPHKEFPLQGRGCWRGPCRQRRQGGRAAAQGWGRAVAARRPHEPARLWRAGATATRPGRWGEQPQPRPPTFARKKWGAWAAAAEGRHKEHRFVKDWPMAAPYQGLCPTDGLLREQLWLFCRPEVNITCYV